MVPLIRQGIEVLLVSFKELCKKKDVLAGDHISIMKIDTDDGENHVQLTEVTAGCVQ